MSDRRTDRAPDSSALPGGPLTIPQSQITRALMECAEVGPWTPEAVSTMMSLAGTFAACSEPHEEPCEEHLTFDLSEPVVLFGHHLTLHTSGWADPTPQDPDRWFWYIDVWTDLDSVSGMLMQWHTQDRDELLDLITGIRNLCHLSATVLAAAS